MLGQEQETETELCSETRVPNFRNLNLKLTMILRRDVSGLTPRGPRVRVLRVNRQARHLSSDLERIKEIHVFGNVE